MKVRYERGALADLDEIFAYIAADNRGAAARLVAELEEAAAKLGRNPELGAATSRAPFRKLVIGNFLIVYEIAIDEVIIHYVRHGARLRRRE